MALAGSASASSTHTTKRTKVLPLVTYLENPEKIVVRKDAHAMAHLVLNSFSNVTELATLLLKATEDDSPYIYLDELGPIFEAHQQAFVDNFPRLSRLLLHVFRMREIEHESIKEYLNQLNTRVKTTNNNNEVLTLAALYQEELLTYRRLCYLGLQKAHIWYALLTNVMPGVKSKYSKESSADSRSILVYNLCVEIFDPCTNLMQRIVGGDAIGADAFNDYLVVKEKLNWMIKFLPEYFTDLLLEFKTPLPETDDLKQSRLTVDCARLNSLLFFMYHSRIFMTLIGSSIDAAKFARLNEGFLKSFDEVVSDRNIYPVEFYDEFTKIILQFRQSTAAIERSKNAKSNTANTGLTLSLFEAVGNRPRMRTFKKLETFYTDTWLGNQKPRKGDHSRTIIAKCKAYIEELARSRKYNRVLKKFDDLMVQFQQILDLYISLDSSFKTKAIFDSMFDVLNSTFRLNDDNYEKQDVIAVSLMRGLIENMRSDLNADQLVNALELESNKVDELNAHLEKLDLSGNADEDASPVLLFNDVFKEVPKELEPPPIPLIKERLKRRGYQ